jgi:hypothetical protein
LHRLDWSIGAPSKPAGFFHGSDSDGPPRFPTRSPFFLFFTPNPATNRLSLSGQVRPARCLSPPTHANEVVHPLPVGTTRTTQRWRGSLRLVIVGSNLD